MYIQQTHSSKRFASMSNILQNFSVQISDLSQVHPKGHCKLFQALSHGLLDTMRVIHHHIRCFARTAVAVNPNLIILKQVFNGSSYTMVSKSLFPEILTSEYRSRRGKRTCVSQFFELNESFWEMGVSFPLWSTIFIIRLCCERMDSRTTPVDLRVFPQSRSVSLPSEHLLT